MLGIDSAWTIRKRRAWSRTGRCWQERRGAIRPASAARDLCVDGADAGTTLLLGAAARGKRTGAPVHKPRDGVSRLQVAPLFLPVPSRVSAWVRVAPQEAASGAIEQAGVDPRRLQRLTKMAITNLERRILKCFQHPFGTIPGAC